ncbi:hypothetical protein ACE1OE_08500 [Vibrio sp. E150_011]
MKKIFLATTLLLATSILPVHASEERDHRRPPSFDELDVNGDGELTKDEVKGPLFEDFDQFDVDSNGTLTESELPEPKRKR